jgi:hypothetical protein
MQLTWRLTDKEDELAIPGGYVDDLVFHQLHCQLRVQQVAFLHLHEALVQQFQT